VSKKQVTSKSAYEKRKRWLDLHEFWNSVTWGFLSIALSLFGMFLSFSVSQSKSPTPDILSLKALTYFVGGIVLLAFIVVGIANFRRRKNRSAILLKRRLSEIYLSALRSSAFNPQLGSPTSDE
jgi:uncharacterized membrane protein HdeD (DUF308 family)